MEKIWSLIKKLFSEKNGNTQLGNQNISGNSNVVDNRKYNSSSTTQINNSTTIVGKADKFVHDPLKKVWIQFLQALPYLFFVISCLLAYYYKFPQDVYSILFILLICPILSFSLMIAGQDRKFVKNRYPYYYFGVILVLIVLAISFNYIFKVRLEKYLDDFLGKFGLWQKLKLWITNCKIGITSGDRRINFPNLLQIMYSIALYTVTLFTAKNCVLEQNYILIEKSESNQKIFLPFIMRSLVIFVVYFIIK